MLNVGAKWSSARPKGPIMLAGKILLLIIPVACVSLLLFCVLPKNPYSYFHGFAFKEGLLKTTRSPKVVLVGGSNLAFGINSHTLSRELGMNVVNPALHAGLGLGYILNSVEPFIEAGDIVVLGFEYELYSATASIDNTTLCELLFEEPRAFKYLGCEHIPIVVAGVGRVLQQRLLRYGLPFLTNDIYNATAFDDYGDVSSHLGKPSRRPFLGSFGEKMHLSRAVLRRLGRFIQRAEQKGARVFLFPPACLDRAYSESEKVVDGIYDEVRAKFPAHTLSSPGECAYSGDYLFDSIYHLNSKGRVLRSEIIVQYLRVACKKAATGGWRGVDVNSRTMQSHMPVNPTQLVK